MKLRKTIRIGCGVYRIFELAPAVFHVLDAGGHTVDEFLIAEATGAVGRVRVRRTLEHSRPQPGVPDVANAFAADLNAERSSTVSFRN